MLTKKKEHQLSEGGRIFFLEHEARRGKKEPELVVSIVDPGPEGGKPEIQPGCRWYKNHVFLCPGRRKYGPRLSTA